MICIGGPMNGKNLDWSGPYFKAPVYPKRRVDWNPSLDQIVLEPIPVVTYYPQNVITKSGQIIPVWVIE